MLIIQCPGFAQEINRSCSMLDGKEIRSCSMLDGNKKLNLHTTHPIMVLSVKCVYFLLTYHVDISGKSILSLLTGEQ